MQQINDELVEALHVMHGRCAQLEGQKLVAQVRARDISSKRLRFHCLYAKRAVRFCGCTRMKMIPVVW